MYKVYGDMLSGNCYKIKLLLNFLNITHEWIHIDILANETQSQDFKLKNPNSKIPVIQISDQEFLSESNAILNFLAEGSSFLPDSTLAKAKVLQWQFFEQYSHEPYIAVARYIKVYLGLPDERRDEYFSKHKGGYKALSVMEQQLSQSSFFVGNSPSIADISLYAYTHVAHEGGFDLAEYLKIKEWMQRIEAIPGYIAMSRENA